MTGFPMRLWGPISHRQYERCIDEFMKYLTDVEKFTPDVVVGVHYGGMGFAADIARSRHKDLCRARIHYIDEDGRHKCDDVALEFDESRINGKNVLVVDNSIISGMTLRMVRDEIAKHAMVVRTLVVFRRPRREMIEAPPDFVMFAGRATCRRLFR